MREEILKIIRENPELDVLIIGGGVNGIATFRDLALQGINVLLVEKRDFCSGASAGSSHMAHGGLRYLENAEFRLVREALRERNRLLIHAPHYVHPLPTTIPIFHWLSGTINAPLKFLGLTQKTTNRGALIIKAGLTLYDMYANRQRTMPRHDFHGRKKSLEIRPQLHPDVVCSVTYYDAWIENPEQLCVEMILDAEALNPNAHALNYVSFASTDGAKLTLQDEVTQETLIVQPKIVINAGGPWIDFVNQNIQQPTQFIGGTKGSHIIINHPELFQATAGSEMFFENEDGRITLFFPYLDKVMAGTTDIPISDPDYAKCTEDEVDYILASIRQVFPNIVIERSHIVFRFTGVRPLPTTDANSPGQISRDHSIKVTETGVFPVLSLVGGKWTTFRAFGEQVTDAVLQRLGRTRQADTREMAIGGGKNYPTDASIKKQWLTQIQAQTGLPTSYLETLLKRYGTRAEAIAEFIAEDEDTPLDNLRSYSKREVQYIARHDKLVHLDDFVLRRSLLAILGNLNHAILADIARAIGEALNWSDEQCQAELQRCTARLEDFHHMNLSV